MKLCICLSGQIRDNTEVSFKALQNLVTELEKEGVETTLIFSIWEEISRKLEGIINLKQLSKIFVNDVVPLIPPAWYGKKLWDNLPKSYAAIQENESKNAHEYVKKYFPNAIIDLENGQLLDLFIYNTPTNDINSKKMLYKVWRVNEIKKKIERDSKTKFDFVIRVRPDYTINKINLDIDKNTIYIPNARTEHTALEDNFAMGSSEAIDYYVELFPKSISSLYRWKGIHYMLSDHFKGDDSSSPKFTIKSTQENGFLLEHMTQNTNMLDLEDLSDDLCSDFYTNIFTVIRLKREEKQESILKAISVMEETQSLCQDTTNYLIFYMLLHDIYIKNKENIAALKAILMTDLNYVTINPKAVGWDHRINFILDLVINLLNKLKLKQITNLMEDLKNLNANSFIDQQFNQLDKTKIIENLNLYAQSDSGKMKLLKNNIFYDSE